MCLGLHVKCFVIFSDFNQNRNIATNFNKSPKYEHKSLLLLYADKGRMDLTRLIFDIFNFCTNGYTKETINNWIENVVMMFVVVCCIFYKYNIKIEHSVIQNQKFLDIKHRLVYVGV